MATETVEIDPVVLYDIFVEEANRLSGLYLMFSRKGDKEFWLQQVEQLDAEQDAVDPFDADAQQTAMKRWGAEYERLTHAAQVASA